MNYTAEEIASSHYGYVPNTGANMFAIIAFGLILLVQLAQGIYFRQWWFATTWFLGLALETIGYGTRVGSIWALDNFMYYCIQTSFLTIAPAFLMAGIYYQLAKIVTVYGQNFSYLKPKTYTRLFIACDVVSIFIQAGGGGVASSSKGGNMAKIGQDLMIVGLVTQVVSMVVFIALFCVVIHRIRNSSSTEYDPNWASVRQRPMFRWFIPALLTSVILILIRSIYRVVELAQGWSSAIARTERWQLIFDGLLMLLACLILTVVHPGACLGRRHIPIDGSGSANYSDFTDEEKAATFRDDMYLMDKNSYNSRTVSVRS